MNLVKTIQLKLKKKIISLNQNLESLQLLSENTINHHIKKFNHIHIGLVQVVIKPLFSLGLDILVFVYLRYAKSTKFIDFVLSIIDSNLANDHLF